MKKARRKNKKQKKIKRKKFMKVNEDKYIQEFFAEGKKI